MNVIIDSDEDIDGRGDMLCINPRNNPTIPNILNGQVSSLIVGTAKALLHLNANTYMIDSVLEFDHPNTLTRQLNVDINSRNCDKPASFGALSPLAAKAMQIATSRHPLKGLPDIQLSTGCIFNRVDKSMNSTNNRKANSCTSSLPLYMFI